MEPHAARFMPQLPATTAVLLAAMCIAWFVAALGWIPAAIDDESGVPAWFSRGEVAIPAPDAPSDSTACDRCGTIESVRLVEKTRRPPGVASLSGGKGGEVMAVLHVVLNAMVGNPTDPIPAPSHEITVRFHDGSMRTITGTGTEWKTGDPVRVVNGRIKPGP
jgi:hypothetical protein